MNDLQNLVQSYLDQVSDQLFSFTTEERLIEWEDTALKVARYAGYALGAFALVSVSAYDGFPHLFRLYSTPLFILTSIISTAYMVYNMYQQKLEKIRKDSSTRIFQLPASTNPLQPDEERKYLFLGAKVKELLIDNKSLSSLDAAGQTTFFANIHKYFPNLTRLDLKELKIDQAVDLTPLGNLGLETLTISSSSINDTQLNVFGKNQKLKKLSVQSCHKISKDAFNNFTTSIEDFELQYCRLDPTLNIKEAEKAVLPKLLANTSANSNIMEKMRQKEKFVDEELGMTSVDKKNYAFIHSWKELKSLSLSHIDDDGVKELYPQLPKLETLTISHSLALTGECFFRQKMDTIKHLILNNCYNLKIAVFASLCAQKSLEKVSFAFDPTENMKLSNVTIDVEFTNFRKSYKVPDKTENTFLGTWVRKERTKTTQP